MILDRVARVLFSRLRGFFRGLTASERAFIEQNNNIWARRHIDNLKCADNYVFVNHELYPLALLGNMHIASAIADAKKAGLLLISPSWLDRAANRVLKSFPGAKLEYRDHPRYVLYRIWSYVAAVRELVSIKTPEDLLRFECDGVLFGDSLYDSILARGAATVASIEWRKLLPVMASLLYNRAVTLRILRKYPVVAGMSTHIVGVPGSVFLRYLLKHGIEVFIRETTLKKYSSLEMMHECCATSDKRYIDYMRKHPDLFASYGERALDSRLGNKNISEVDHLAYKSDKVVYHSRLQFGADFSLDPEKKNVFVMLHAFNDYPHTYGSMVHRDFYHWFMHVLQMAKKNTSVNWVFKNHPYEKYYPTDVNVAEIFAGIDESHIRYMPATVNFNTSSLCHVGDVVITCLGTAGLEYSAFGIPCILAARCWYSGFGFTREPKDRKEFEHELINIANLHRLTDEQVAMAKSVAYFSFEAMNQLKFPDPFRTIATYNLDDAKAMTPDKMIQMILDFRSASSPEEKSAYMSALYAFIRDPHWVQFVDFSRHPELRNALRQVEAYATN